MTMYGGLGAGSNSLTNGTMPEYYCLMECDTFSGRHNDEIIPTIGRLKLLHEVPMENILLVKRRDSFSL